MNKQAEKSRQVESEIQLHFKGPYNRPVMAHLVVSNPSRKSTAFKVKTKAPKRYSGTSNKGIILPGASFKMSFSLKPLREGEQETRNHKLAITFASSDVTGSVEAIFAAAKSEEIKTFPIRCVLDDLPVVESIRDGKKGAMKNAPSLQKEIKSAEVITSLPYQRLYPDLSQLRLDDEKYFVLFSPKSATPGGDDGDQGKEADQTL